jgi:hypothetical protein
MCPADRYNLDHTLRTGVLLPCLRAVAAFSKLQNARGSQMIETLSATLSCGGYWRDHLCLLGS